MHSAGFWLRLWATVIDSLLFALWSIPLMSAIYAGPIMVFFSSPQHNDTRVYIKVWQRLSGKLASQSCSSHGRMSPIICPNSMALA
jgi:hypothetical protein